MRAPPIRDTSDLSTLALGYETDAKVMLAGPQAQHKYRPVRNVKRAWVEEWASDIDNAQSNAAGHCVAAALYNIPVGYVTINANPHMHCDYYRAPGLHLGLKRIVRMGLAGPAAEAYFCGDDIDQGAYGDYCMAAISGRSCDANWSWCGVGRRRAHSPPRSG